MSDDAIDIDNWPPTWTATFPGGLKVVVSQGDDQVELLNESDAPESDALAVLRAIDRSLAHGWPDLAGWAIDTSPGWDPEWNYLRLLAIGAETVDGPFPQQAERDVDPDPDVIVG